MENIYVSIGKLLEENTDFVIATILEKSGSAPREKGAKMLIMKDSSIIGTIGGGMMEALAIKAAKEVFENKLPRIKEFVLSNKEAAALGMICGGDVRVLLEYMDSTRKDLGSIYDKLMEVENMNTNLAIITLIEDWENKAVLNKCIYTGDEIYGNEKDRILEVFKGLGKDFKDISVHEVDKGSDKYIIEKITRSNKLYIIGAGHVGQKISEIMKILGFYVVVMDDRIEFANKDRFNTADEVMVLPSFDNLFEHFTVSDKDYVIIVTRGHAFDKEVLAQCLTSKAKYIGMIGSRRKKQLIYEQLLTEGYTEKELAEVYCPIGLSINADTPEEIAVSIAAEIIQIKNGDKNGKK